MTHATAFLQWVGEFLKEAAGGPLSIDRLHELDPLGGGEEVGLVGLVLGDAEGVEDDLDDRLLRLEVVIGRAYRHPDDRLDVPGEFAGTRVMHVDPSLAELQVIVVTVPPDAEGDAGGRAKGEVGVDVEHGEGDTEGLEE